MFHLLIPLFLHSPLPNSIYSSYFLTLKSCLCGLSSSTFKHLFASHYWMIGIKLCICEYGEEVRWCAVVARSPWEFNYIPTPCRCKAPALRNTCMHAQTQRCPVWYCRQSRESSPSGIDLRTGIIGFFRCVPTLLKVTGRMNATDTPAPNRSIFLCVCVCQM